MKAISCSRTVHFVAGVTYLQFQIQVCFSVTMPDLESFFQRSTILSRTIRFYYLLNYLLTFQVDSAFYPPLDGKMSTSHKAVMLCGWEGNRWPGGK